MGQFARRPSADWMCLYDELTPAERRQWRGLVLFWRYPRPSAPQPIPAGAAEESAGALFSPREHFRGNTPPARPSPYAAPLIIGGQRAAWRSRPWRLRRTADRAFFSRSASLVTSACLMLVGFSSYTVGWGPALARAWLGAALLAGATAVCFAILAGPVQLTALAVRQALRQMAVM